MMLVAASAALAAPAQPFSMAAFEAAQRAGRPILVDAYADWCPVCRLQAMTLDKIERDKSFDNLVILRIDYDHQDEAKRRLGVNQQSTLIAFHGAQETGRLVGVVDGVAITALAKSAQSGRPVVK
jgi:thiol:disulfide interchange protein